MHHSHIDKFAYQDSPVHRIDGRVKFLTVVIFTAFVLSLPPGSFTVLTCYAVGPFTVLVLGKIPLKFVFRQILLISPFILVLALSCPFYDRTAAAVALGPFVWHISAGWLRCFAILGKFIVTMMALIALVSTTRFADLLVAMQKLGTPKILIVQLGFLYRYIFVLIDKAHHILRARAVRKLRRLAPSRELKVAASMIGSLFVRSIDTAERINIAMQARGFSGTWPATARLKLRPADFIFAAIAAAFIAIVFFYIRPVLG